MQRPIPFISRVRLKNFKSIADCDVRLSPLTVLVGPNGSGKSNFLDALAFMARALETNLSTAVEERGGLPEFLCRVPRATDSFSIDVDVAMLSGRTQVTGRYGFEVGRRQVTSFEVRRENCSLHWDEGGSTWERDRTAVRAKSQQLAVMDTDRLYLPVAGSLLTVRDPIFPFAGTLDAVVDPNTGARSAAISTPVTGLSRALTGMRLYSFGLDELRRPQPQSAGAVLGRRGEHLADVLGALEEDHHLQKKRLDAYLAAVLPDVVTIEQYFAGGGYTAFQMLSRNQAGNLLPAPFGSNAMSDGTIRAAAVLASLFQSATLDGRVPLVGIEEPETALHPAAAGVLFDALSEASDHVQVLATSQSADLLDRDDLDVSVVRAVTMEHGLTTIGEIDAASREIVGQRLYTLGELMRGNQIRPDSLADGYAAPPES
jgi:predicted ATPase